MKYSIKTFNKEIDVGIIEEGELSDGQTRYRCTYSGMLHSMVELAISNDASIKGYCGDEMIFDINAKFYNFQPIMETIKLLFIHCHRKNLLLHEINVKT